MATLVSTLKRPRPFRAPLGVPVGLYVEDRRLLALGINLSPTGMFLSTRRAFATGTTVQIELGIEDECFLVDAEIVRHDPGQGIGLRFPSLARDAQLAIIAFVAKRRDEMETAEYSRAARAEAVANRGGRPAPQRRPPPRIRVLPDPRSPAKVLLKVAGIALCAAAIAAAVTFRPIAPDNAELAESADSAPADLRGTVATARSVERAAVPEAPAVATSSLPATDSASAAPDTTAAATTSEASPTARPAAPEAQPDAATGELKERVTTHLSDADRRLAHGDLSTPEGESALDHYRAALELDPGNSRARAGVAAVTEIYVHEARTLAAAGDRPAALARLKKALEILELEPAARGIVDRAARARDIRALADVFAAKPVPVAEKRAARKSRNRVSSRLR